MFLLLGIDNLIEVDTPMRAPDSRNRHPDTENSEVVNVPTSPAAQISSSQTSQLFSNIDLSSPLNYGTPSSMGSLLTPRSGVRGTPVRARPDIRTDRRMHLVNVASDQVRVNINWFTDKITNLTIYFSWNLFLRLHLTLIQFHQVRIL